MFVELSRKALKFKENYQLKQLTPNALQVLKTRYLVKNDQGEVVETPEQLFKRVAKAVASVEDPKVQSQWEDTFCSLMSNLDFLPNTPTLVNAGRDGGYGVYSACFVLPIKDHMLEIFETIKRTAILHQTGAGTGYSLSELRPKGAPVSKRIGIASGPVSWMKVFNAAVEEIKQGGTRRGAMLFALADSHPDVFEFAMCKQDEKQMKNANISVAATDAFMEAVEKDLDWTLTHPSGHGTRTIKARQLWDTIIDSAWRTGDPGLLFIDEANRHNPTPHVFKLASTNPCGEQWLGPNESCNLGSINLINFVSKEEEDLDWIRLEQTIQNCVRFLDNVIDLSKFPFPELTDMVKGNRRIGLGIMGWADVLIALGIRYDSPKALTLAHKLGAFFRNKSDEASMALGAEKGSFPNFKGSVYDGKIATMRNACRTTIAPTGTISLIANETSSGIEPVFAFSHKSNRMNTTLDHSHWFSKDWAQKNPGKYLPEYCVEAHDVSPEAHIRTQAVFQKYIDNSISKTINLPNSATREDIATAYMLAWKLKCKGITIFRDGCKSSGQILEHTSTKAAPAEPTPAFGADSKYFELKTGHGNLHVHIDHKEGKAYRVFTNLPPVGAEISGLVTILGVTISKYLELGGNLENLIKHYQSVISDKPYGLGAKKVFSIPYAIALTFKHFLKQVQGKDVQVGAPVTIHSCPECHSSNFSSQEGCSLCHECGYSACS